MSWQSVPTSQYIKYRKRYDIGSGLLLVFAFILSGNLLASTPQPSDPQLRALLKKTINQADSFTDRFDAEVWLVDMSTRLKRFIKNDKKRLKLLREVHKAAVQASIEPELVLALIQVESRFNRFAISSVGAQGLMQVMPFWKNEIGRPYDNLTINRINLQYGCTILKHYIDIENGNISRALDRYNGSLGQYRYSAKVLDVWQKYWFVNNSYQTKNERLSAQTNKDGKD